MVERSRRLNDDRPDDPDLRTYDACRGMAVQKAADLRRLLSEVEANEKILRERQSELEARLLAAPAVT